MVTNKIKELSVARAKVAALEQSIAAEMKSELAGLPAKYGFPSVGEFIAAVRAAAGKRRGRRPNKVTEAKPERKRRKRAIITDETRQAVKKLANDGKTGSEIAKTVGISLSSVQNIKKALGLVGKNRK
jgi:hypothetical protein